MAFFKIEKSGCNVRKGLLQIRYDLFWDDKDKEYALTEARVFPEEGYPGKTDERGFPVDIEDYQKWEAALPTKFVHNPFCCHFVYAEPTITDEEILFVGELALDMAEKNYRKGDLTLNKNMPVQWKPAMESQSLTKLESVKTLDVATVNNAEEYRVK